MTHYDDCPCDDCTFVENRGRAKLATVLVVLGVLVLALLVLLALT